MKNWFSAAKKNHAAFRVKLIHTVSDEIAVAPTANELTHCHCCYSKRRITATNAATTAQFPRPPVRENEARSSKSGQHGHLQKCPEAHKKYDTDKHGTDLKQSHERAYGHSRPPGCILPHVSVSRLPAVAKSMRKARLINSCNWRELIHAQMVNSHIKFYNNNNAHQE